MPAGPPGDGAGPRGDPRRRRRRRPATASRGSTWPCSARSPTTTARTSRPSWSCSRSRLDFSLYDMSSWTRTIVVPLSIISALQAGPATCRRSRGIAELFRTDLPRASTPDRARPGPGRTSSSASTACFKWADRGRAAARWRRPGLARGAPLDARALRELRRPRRDLPADDLHGRRPEAASATSPTRAAVPLGAAAARRPADRGGRHGPRPALRLAGLGHGDRHDRPGRRRRARPTTRR